MLDRDEMIGLGAMVAAGTLLIIWGYAVARTIWVMM